MRLRKSYFTIACSSFRLAICMQITAEYSRMLTVRERRKPRSQSSSDLFFLYLQRTQQILSFTIENRLSNISTRFGLHENNFVNLLLIFRPKMDNFTLQSLQKVHNLLTDKNETSSNNLTIMYMALAISNLSRRTVNCGLALLRAYH